VRRAYVEDLRERYAHRDLPWRHWSRVVDRIEAGNEEVVSGWQISKWVRVDPWAYVRLELDGTVTLVEPVRVGADIVAWERVA
jgi:hypothetical protein